MTREEIEHLFVLNKYDARGIIDLNEIVKGNDDSVISRVRHHSDGFVKDNWAKKKSDNVYELTEWGNVLKKYLIRKDESENKTKWFWNGAIVSFIAAFLSGLGVALLITQSPPPLQCKYTEFPKTVLVCDTIVLKDTVWINR